MSVRGQSARLIQIREETKATHTLPTVEELAVAHRIAQLQPSTDPQSVEPVLREKQPRLLQFSEPLPGRVLDAAAEALTASPNIGFRVYGRTVDPSLEWLQRFVDVRDLTIDLWHATSFDLLSSFKKLRRLSLGQTASKRPSLAFLRELPALEVLRVEAHDRDFDAIGDVATLRELYLRVPRAKTLDPLRGHPRLEAIEIDFGGIRDLTPLAEIPGLRGLQLYQVREFDTDDLAAVGACRSLIAVSLGALRNVTRLSALAEGPRRTLRYLTIERLTGLETLADLAQCEALEQLYLTETKPKDGRLDLVARAPALRHLVVGDHYPKQQLRATENVFAGEPYGCEANHYAEIQSGAMSLSAGVDRSRITWRLQRARSLLRLHPRPRPSSSCGTKENRASGS